MYWIGIAFLSGINIGMIIMYFRLRKLGDRKEDGTIYYIFNKDEIKN